MSGLNLLECLQIARVAAKKAGDLIAASFHNRNVGSGALEVTVKENEADLVTDVDKASEELIKGLLLHKFPAHRFLGEESGMEEVLSDEPTWVVDPIDGTTNFIHAIPHTCVAIALCINKEPVVGVVFNPLTNEMFTGAQGHGAFMNDRPISIRRAANLKKAVVAINVGYSRANPEVDILLGLQRKLLFAGVRSIRMSGSAALDMCNVACGRLDCFYEKGIHAWDIAAGSIIVREAGGIAVNTEGGPLDLCARKIFTGSRETVQAILDVLAAPASE
eukprot:gnl/Hemi2/18311_TR6057_c0_g1_i1.p1 gnl/Hemi2/18311_TR6057_c0_g1~~gnl/Hemi2/18311_TR6057_c0_g1_i1.p1  ORF type:complete len:276 (-),score=58.98 gnl/Hemi2/18311_TR6057_c0_g1_i1:134-961(-)